MWFQPQLIKGLQPIGEGRKGKGDQGMAQYLMGMVEGGDEN